MKCEYIQDLMTDYLNNGLALEQKNIFIRHISVCKQCRTVLADLSNLKRRMSNVMQDIPIGIKSIAFSKISVSSDHRHDIIPVALNAGLSDLISYAMKPVRDTLDLLTSEI